MAQGSAVIGALRVNLAIDTAEFENGLKSVQRNLGRIGAVLGTALAGAAGAAAFAIGQVVRRADEMGKTAQKLGIPVETLSQLSHAASLADVSIESLSTAFRTMLKAGNDPLPTMLRIADQFQRMPDGAQKSAIAVKNFGRSGLELIPLLNQGSGAIRELMAEADRLGLTITRNTAAAAERFNDNLTRLQAVVTGVATQMATAMLPALDRTAQKLTDFATNTGAARAAGELLGNAMEAVATELAEVDVRLENIGRTFTALKTILKMDAISLFNGEAWAVLKKSIDDNRAALEALDQRMLATQRWGRGGFGGGTQIISRGGAAPDQPLATVTDSVKKATFAFGDYREVSGRALTETETLAERVRGVFDNFGDTLADSLMGAVEGTQSLKDAFKDLATDMLRQVTRLALSSAFQSIFGAFGGLGAVRPGVGTGGMGFLNFGGPRQHGGPVGRGRAYMVGERGPEMFVPRSSGSIVPSVGANIQIIDQRTTASPPVEVQQGGGMQRFVIRDAVRSELPNQLNKFVPAQFGTPQRLKQRG